MGLVLLDTGVVIGFLQSDDAFHEPARDAIGRLATEHRFIASSISYAELLTGVQRSQRAAEALRGFFSEFVAEIVAVDELVAEHAAELRTQLKLKLPDALILGTAQLAPADAGVLTTDASWKRLRLSVPVSVLRT